MTKINPIHNNFIQNSEKEPKKVSNNDQKSKKEGSNLKKAVLVAGLVCTAASGVYLVKSGKAKKFINRLKNNTDNPPIINADEKAGEKITRAGEAVSDGVKNAGETIKDAFDDKKDEIIEVITGGATGGAIIKANHALNGKAEENGAKIAGEIAEEVVEEAADDIASNLSTKTVEKVTDAVENLGDSGKPAIEKGAESMEALSGEAKNIDKKADELIDELVSDKAGEQLSKNGAEQIEHVEEQISEDVSKSVQSQVKEAITDGEKELNNITANEASQAASDTVPEIVQETVSDAAPKAALNTAQNLTPKEPPAVHQEAFSEGGHIQGQIQLPPKGRSQHLIKPEDISLLPKDVQEKILKYQEQQEMVGRELDDITQSLLERNKRTLDEIQKAQTPPKPSTPKKGLLGGIKGLFS